MNNLYKVYVNVMRIVFINARSKFNGDILSISLTSYLRDFMVINIACDRDTDCKSQSIRKRLRYLGKANARYSNFALRCQNNKLE